MKTHLRNIFISITINDASRNKHLSERNLAELGVCMRIENHIKISREFIEALIIDEGNLVKCKTEKLLAK